MILRTTVPVDFNKGQQRLSGIVTMELGSVQYVNDFKQIGVNFTYSHEGSAFNSNAFYLDGADNINGLFAIIQGDLPPFENEVDNTRWKFLYGARYEMARTFSISVDQIEFVDTSAPEPEI